MDHKRKRSPSIHSLLQRIKVFIMSNSTPVRTRRSNTVNGRITERSNPNNTHTLRKYKSSTDITHFDTQQSWSHVTELYTLCLEPSHVAPSTTTKYMQKDHYENWWSQTPTLQSMA
ncbi:hypothetical protein K501DRAFT_288416 [Backusella circina FSU 941]|nr:hypothetical protein K501DRAFT_288416 [Backusella circina FSU 941]